MFNNPRLRNALLRPFRGLLTRLVARPRSERLYALIAACLVSAIANAAVFAFYGPLAALLMPALLVLISIPYVSYYLFSGEMLRSKTPDHGLRTVVNTPLAMSLASQLFLQFKLVGWFGFSIILALTLWLFVTAMASLLLMTTDHITLPEDNS